MISRPALVLFSHGSLLCGSEQLVKLHVHRLRETGQYTAVEAGYLNYSHPPVEDAIQRCIDMGADAIIIVPYFLVAGKFVTQDLPPRLSNVMAAHPLIKFSVARAIEDSPEMLDAIIEATATATDPLVWQGDAIAAAKERCQLRADCPLYKSPACRAEELQ